MSGGVVIYLKEDARLDMRQLAWWVWAIDVGFPTSKKFNLKNIIAYKLMKRLLKS